MNRNALVATASAATLGLAILAGSLVIAADPPKPAEAGAPEFKLPPGWTMDDMKACMLASTPGKMHEFLAKAVGVWQGKNTMWMGLGGDPVKSVSTCTITAIMDGRYTRADVAGDMPGMGPYLGTGTYGYDNVLQKFVATWIDNQGTGIMTGTGGLSADAKTLTWSMTFQCPINKRPAVMREVETITGPNTRTLEMFGPDPKTGREFKMMSVEMTRKP